MAATTPQVSIAVGNHTDHDGSGSETPTCKHCHPGHSGGVTVPMPPTAYTVTGLLTNVDMAKVLGFTPDAATGKVIWARDFKKEFGAALLIAFLVPTTLLFHSPWDPAQQTQFLKNVGLIGGLLLVVSSRPRRRNDSAGGGPNEGRAPRREYGVAPARITVADTSVRIIIRSGVTGNAIR